MINLALQRIQKMKPYTLPPGTRREYDGMLLDFNEHVGKSGKKIIRALEKFIQNGNLNRYPEYVDLKKKIAAYAGVQADQIMITNGSDQGIDIIFRTFTEKGDHVIIPSPSFAIFYQHAQIEGNKMICPLYQGNDKAFPMKEVMSLINEKVKLIIVCNPNNPTGTTVSVADIAKIAKKAKKAIVYVDEAYFEFSNITAKSLIKTYPNILITRTFSKAFGLASLRIGYILARKEYINEMLKLRAPYEVNMAAYYAACAALEEKSSMERYSREIMDKAKPLVEQFFLKHSIPYAPSGGNFILFHPSDPEKTVKKLARKGVLVRLQKREGMETGVRITLGTMKHMKKFIKIYTHAILKKAKQKYALLDRDGTLIFEPQDTYQVDTLKKLKILNGVIDGLQELQKKGYKLIITSNQDGLNTPLFPQRKFQIPHAKMLNTFKRKGIHFEHVFICPHLPEDHCSCRKPQTGMVDKFLRKTRIDKKSSFVCGDRDTDRQFAKNLGIAFVPMKTNGNFYDSIKPQLTPSV